MSTSDPKHPKDPQPAASAGGGVRVILNEPPPWERADPEPEVEEQRPRVVVFPSGQSKAERDRYVAWLFKEWLWLIDGEIARRRSIAPKSRQDVRQIVLMVATREYEKEGPPDDVPAFLATVIRNATGTYMQRKKLDIEQEADVDDQIGSAPTPERLAYLAELRERLARYVHVLTPAEREAIELIELEGMIIDDAALKLGRPRGTVANQYARGMRKLRDEALASDRAVARGERRLGS
jgi:RNA polymerase sigma factor (sigma-70 family)